MNPPTGRRRFALGIRAWVLIASMLAVLPLLGFSSWIVFALEQNQHAGDDTALLQRTQALSLTVKRRLDRAAIALQALAVSPAALQQDFGSLYDQSRRVMETHPDAVAISLVRRDGEQMFSTFKAFGAALPRSPAVGYEESVFDQGAVVYSPLFVGSVSKRMVMVVSVPIRIDGRIDYALRMSLPTEALTAVLQDQMLPADWTAAVIDPHRTIAGRTGEAARLVGQPVSDSLRGAIEHQTPCPFVTLTHSGLELSSCTVRVPGSDWAVAVGVPTALFEHELRDSLLKVLAAGLASMLLGIGGALFIANLVRAQVKLLAAAAFPDPADADHDPRASPIREIATVGEGLRHARRRGDELASQLSDAKHDALTGLAGRRLFNELVERDLLGVSAGVERIALLFVDLDGFKAINDRLGHDAGDDLLRDVASAIRGVVRAHDIASRIGGDEFVVYLRGDVDELPATCADVASRLIERVGKLCDGLGCSIGVAVGPADRAGVADLLSAADRLMLQAKSEGKGRYLIESTA